MNGEQESHQLGQPHHCLKCWLSTLLIHLATCEKEGPDPVWAEDLRTGHSHLSSVAPRPEAYIPVPVGKARAQEAVSLGAGFHSPLL